MRIVNYPCKISIKRDIQYWADKHVYKKENISVNAYNIIEYKFKLDIFILLPFFCLILFQAYTTVYACCLFLFYYCLYCIICIFILNV